MTSRLQVTGAGCTTSLGRGLEALASGWADGRRGIAPVRRFETTDLAVHLGGEMPDPLAPTGTLRGAAHLDEALDEALTASGLPAGSRVKIVVATAKGFLASGAQVAGRHAAHDIGLPARHVERRLRERLGCMCSSAPRVEDAHRCNASGPLRAQTVSMACASGTAALALAAAVADAWIDAGADAVVVAGVDLLSDFVYRGFAALEAVDPAPCRPFDRRRAGMTPAEAAAVIVLEPESRAAARGAPRFGTLLSGGLANDACHPTAPDREGLGMARAVLAALAGAGTAPAELGHVHAHGTGTVFNDAMEVAALQAALGRAARNVPVTTIKGHTGHAFGAAGLVETLASLEAVRRGELPGIAGLEAPEDGLDLVSEPRAIAGARFLEISAGFGGFDAAVVLEGVRGR